MSISDATQLLFIYFEENDSYTHSSDYKKLKWNLLNEDKNSTETEQEASILAALSILEEDKFLKKVSFDDKSKKTPTYVLMQSQKNNGIEIEVSKQTAEKLSNLVNSILPMLDINITEKSHPKHLGEADMIVILQGFSILSEQLENINKKQPKTNE